MRRPTFLGIGAQKCASSWIHDVLADHPEVFVSEPKELDFFCNHYHYGFQWYGRHFEGAGGATAVGEISPGYFWHPEAPRRARDWMPDLRIVLALRDPVERAFSNHLHEVRKGHFRGSDLSFEAGLRNNPMYRHQSLYATHLSAWLAAFPRDRILVMLAEEVQENPAREAMRLYDFLGVSAAHRSARLFARSHESVMPRNRLLGRTLRGLGDALRRVGLEGAVGAVKRAGPVDALLKRNRQSLREVVPPMLPQTVERLQAEFAEEVLRLAALLRRPDLPWPTFRRAAERAAAPTVRALARP
ncbi:MAG TPA: sulfotransferase [Azospirillum sp.]|nr:sulfotransferase [Azospirillum sp.]